MVNGGIGVRNIQSSLATEPATGTLGPVVGLPFIMRETKTWLPFTRSLNGCGDYTPAAFDCHQGCLSRENEERTRERLISSGINTIQPRVHIDFTQSRLVVIAAVFVSRIMKGQRQQRQRHQQQLVVKTSCGLRIINWG